MSVKKTRRRQVVLNNTLRTLNDGFKNNKHGQRVPLSEEDTSRLSKEAAQLYHYLNGGKKATICERKTTHTVR